MRHTDEGSYLTRSTSVLGGRSALDSERADPGPHIDVPTLIALAVVAWAATNVLHEIVGHAGAAVLVGIPVEAVSTTTAFIDSDQIQSAAEARIINAAGAIVNLLTGAIAVAVLHVRKRDATAVRCFLWLFATMSFVIVTMNLVTAPLLGGGDWTEVIEGLEPQAAYVAAIVGVGAGLAVAGFVLPLRAWMPALLDRPARLELTWIPVLTIMAFQSLSLLQSPFATAPAEHNHLLASVFAYVHFWLWAILVNLVSKPRSSQPVDSVRLLRSRSWLVAGVVTFALFALVLGPGLGPLENDPRLH